jgi:hypothetical protein
MLSTLDTWLGQLTVTARIGHKWEALLPEPPQHDITTVLVLPPTGLGHPATSPSLPAVPSLAEPAALSLYPRRREEAQKWTGKRTQAKLTPMTQSLEESESFRWTLVWMYLSIAGGICLLLAVHVHIHRPLPHERQ